MREQRAAAAEQEHHRLPAGLAGIDDRQRQRGATDRADRGVEKVPQAVEPGHLVGKELGRRTQRGNADHPRICQGGKRGQVFGHGHHPEPQRNSGREDTQV